MAGCVSDKQNLTCLAWRKFQLPIIYFTAMVFVKGRQFQRTFMVGKKNKRKIIERYNQKWCICVCVDATI